MSTSDRFAGKVAVITGGTTGIGRAIARRFVSDGGKIVIGARHDTLFEEITQELGADNCWCQVCDVTNRAQVDALVEGFAGHGFAEVVLLAKLRKLLVVIIDQQLVFCFEVVEKRPVRNTRDRADVADGEIGVALFL